VEAFTPVMTMGQDQASGEHPYPSLYPPPYGTPTAPQPGHGTMAMANKSPSMAYPSLRDFMGLELTEAMIRENMPEYLDDYTAGGTIATRQPTSGE